MRQKTAAVRQLVQTTRSGLHGDGLLTSERTRTLSGKINLVYLVKEEPQDQASRRTGDRQTVTSVYTPVLGRMLLYSCNPGDLLKYPTL